MRRRRSSNPLAAVTALAATATMAFIPSVLFTALFVAEIVDRYDGITQVYILLGLLVGSWLIIWTALNCFIFGD